MADFRKWFIAFAVLALMLGASTAYAQLPGSGPTQCLNTPSNPAVVRAEGITEQMGDLIFSCFGGNPTPNGSQIPQFDISVTLNANITSRLVPGTTVFGGLTPFIDALLVIDEAFPSSGAFAGFGVTPQQPTGSPTGQRVCFSNTQGTASVPTGCNVFNGTFNTTTFLFNGNPYNQPSASNVFVAHLTGPSQVTWLGVPIDAPGTAGARILRMTNIRANACLVGTGSSLVPSAITAFISITGTTSLVFAGAAQQTVAFVQQGLITSRSPSTMPIFAQCEDQNNLAGGSLNGLNPQIAINLTEGFAASFKRRIAAVGLISDVFDGNNVQGPLQNVVGVNYNSETGFQPPSTAGVVFGWANQGTRFLLVFNNVNNGVRLFVPQFVRLSIGLGIPGNPSPGNAAPVNAGPWQGGWIQLVGGSSDLNGNVNINPTASGTFNNGLASPYNQAVELPVSGGVATAVYEVGNADPAAFESASVAVAIKYTSNTANNLPATGQSTVTASFAPLSTVNGASTSAPIPRFCNKSTAINTFRIDLCTCNLLFPFVSNQSGFDTGIAIANTSLDTLNGVTPESGRVTLSYYGTTTGGGAAPANQTSTKVNAGEEVVFTLSSGGDHGIAATPGFQGYIVAQMEFRWCHGFAFLSDVGAQKLAEGYLAIQLDIPGLGRTLVTGENKGH